MHSAKLAMGHTHICKVQSIDRAEVLHNRRVTKPKSLTPVMLSSWAMITLSHTVWDVLSGVKQAQWMASTLSHDCTLLVQKVFMWQCCILAIAAVAAEAVSSFWKQ